MKNTFLWLLCLFCTVQVSASHISGGQIRYEFNGTNYDVYLELYQVCSGGSTGPTMPTTANISISSVSTSNSMMLSLSQTSLQIISNACTSMATTCTSPTGVLPGYKMATYKASVALPAQATDWVFSYDVSARSVSNNIVGTVNMYINAKLDNSAAINSNAYIANSPCYYMITNSLLSIPIQTVDAEGDSLAYELINPMSTGGISIPYLIGYSVASPFGGSGTCNINASTQTLNMLSTLTGQFAIAFRVKEYRNGNLIGSFVRDFVAVCLPGSGNISIPMPASLPAFSVYTCPGQSNTVTVTFNDATITDSVITVVTPPTIPGWTFSTSVANGIGSGSATITWTTPGTLNPATLPYFYIKLHVRDNACPKGLADYAIIVRTKQCTADSVWPGDANGDFTVNIYDPLAIAIAMGQTGAPRTSPTTTWVAQACTPWANAFVTNNTNMKHADCDGDGTVTTADLTAVTANYGLTHPKNGGEEKQTAGPRLYFDFTGISLVPGTLVNIPIKLGDAGNIMNDIYGLATRISINGAGSVSVPTTISTATTWLGSTGNTINFTKNLTTNIIDWAHARIDHQNTNGQGVIGTLAFTVPTNAVPGATVSFKFSDTKLIDRDGLDITAFNPENNTAIIPFPNNITALPSVVQSVSVTPNPSKTSAVLRLSLLSASTVNIKVTDMVGRVVWQQTAGYDMGNHEMSLPASQLTAGMYTVILEAEGWENSPIVKWVKE
jgi:hypothetical protein